MVGNGSCFYSLGVLHGMFSEEIQNLKDRIDFLTNQCGPLAKSTQRLFL